MFFLLDSRDYNRILRKSNENRKNLKVEDKIFFAIINDLAQDYTGSWIQIVSTNLKIGLRSGWSVKRVLDLNLEVGSREVFKIVLKPGGDLLFSESYFPFRKGIPEPKCS